MKTHLCLLLLAFGSLLHAQESDALVAQELSFFTQKAQFDGKEELALKVVIPLTTFESIERYFKKSIDDYTKSKIEHSGGTYKIQPMDWPVMCDTGATYFGHFEDSPYGLVWISAVECRDRFIQPNDAKAWQDMNRMAKNFAYEVYGRAFGLEVEAQEKRVKGQEKVIKGLESERSRAVKSIENNKNHIKNLETEIHDYDSELEALNTGIAKLRSERVAMTEKEDIKASKAREKEMNKRRDKARKQQAKRNNQILDLNEAISHSEQRIGDIDIEVPDASMILNNKQNELLRLRAEHEKIKLWAKS